MRLARHDGAMKPDFIRAKGGAAKQVRAVGVMTCEHRGEWGECDGGYEHAGRALME